jgi:hypothetical protein
VYSAWYSWYCPTCGQEWMYGDNSRRWGMPNVPHTPWDEAAERVDGPPWKPEPTPHESNTSMMFTQDHAASETRKRTDPNAKVAQW